MTRKDFLGSMLALTAMGTLSNFKNVTDSLPVQGRTMPVLFTSHGNPMDIVRSTEERPLWRALHELGIKLKRDHEIKAVLVVSAHWCTKGTFVNIAKEQQQIFDYYGFPDEYYKVKYSANGDPEVAHEVKKIVSSVTETTDWGLDHGSWPMLMHLFPKGDVPVFQMSIDYNAKPEYHFELSKQLKSLRDKGVLIIGSGALVHNLPLAAKRMMRGDNTLYGWEPEYDAWIKKQIEERNFHNVINYETSHPLGKMAAPTPDHFVPVLYSLGLLSNDEPLDFFYDHNAELPAFSERSFVIGNV
jgi:4,5-DOPA dioxygenase extradiol